MLVTVLTASFLTLNLALAQASGASAASDKVLVGCWTECRDYCCRGRCYDTYRIFTETAPTCYDKYLTCCQSCDCYNNASCDTKCRAKETKCRQPEEKKLNACEKCCKDTGDVLLSGKNANEKCLKRYAKCQDPHTVFETCADSTCP